MIDFFSFLLYRIAIDVCYFFILHPVYGRGQTLVWDLKNFFISYFLAVLAISAAVAVRKKNASFFIYILLLVIILPMTCLYCYRYPYDQYLFMVTGSFFLLWLTVFFPFRLALDLLSQNRRIVIYLRKTLFFAFFMLIILILLRYLSTDGLNRFNLNLTKVYEHRFYLRNIWTGNLWGYFQSWTFAIILPCILSYFLSKKRNNVVFLVFIVHVLLYGFSSHKSVLFSGILVIVLFNILDGSKYPWRSFPFLGSVGILSVSFLTLLFQEWSPVRFVRALLWRIIYLPSEINYWFYEFFSKNEFSHFSHSFMRHFGKENLYAPSPEFVIGELYMGNSEIRANTGFLGSGYMEGGFLVLLVYALLIGMLIRFISKDLSDARERNAVFVFSVIPVLKVFVSSDLPTAFLTGGLWLLILILPLFKASFQDRRD